MLRAVLDTNVLVSGLLVKQGQPARIVDAWRERKFLPAISAPLIAEVRSTLSYPRIRRKYPITDQDVAALIALLEQDALLVPGEANEGGAIPEDAEDEMVLACAVDAEADLIVSGDRHLRDLREFQGIPILTAREFLERLEGEPNP